MHNEIEVSIAVVALFVYLHPCQLEGQHYGASQDASEPITGVFFLFKCFGKINVLLTFSGNKQMMGRWIAFLLPKLLTSSLTVNMNFQISDPFIIATVSSIFFFCYRSILLCNIMNFGYTRQCFTLVKCIPRIVIIKYWLYFPFCTTYLCTLFYNEQFVPFDSLLLYCSFLLPSPHWYYQFSLSVRLLVFVVVLIFTGFLYFFYSICK